MIRFRVSARFLGLGCVGASYREVLGPDILLQKRGDLPYIPGSSFKGALRSAASRVAGSYGFTACGQIRPEKMQPCDVCMLFGMPADYPSLMVEDLLPTSDPVRVTVTRVKINDSSLKAEEGALYTQEHVLGGEFQGRILVLRPERRLLGLLLLSLAELRSGRTGRDSIVDIKIGETGELSREIEEKYVRLERELEDWLWEGVLREGGR